VDCGAVVDGWHGDAAMTVVVPPADDADAELSDLAHDALWAGIAALRVGGHVADVGAAVEQAVGGRAGIIQEYTGHGIGTAMHQPPDVPNSRQRPQGSQIRPGLCVAIEPMLTRGGSATVELDDGWTVLTADGSRAAHWEHSVAVLADGLCVLTAHDGGAARLGSVGVPVVSLDC
jgi:methionyl aminopeptidase